MTTTERMIQVEETAHAGTELGQEDFAFLCRARREFPSGSDLHTRAGRLLVKAGKALPVAVAPVSLQVANVF